MGILFVFIFIIILQFLDGEVKLWCEKINEPQLHENISKKHSARLTTARKSTTFGRLFAIGGSESDKVNDCLSVEQYSNITNTWKRFHDIPGYRKHFSTVHINRNELVIIGGWNKFNVCTATV